MLTRRDLASDLLSLGLTSGDVVMVHASLRAVGEVAGGPDQVHLAIKDVITDRGTMFMYASCPDYVDDVGRGNLTPEQEAEVLAKLPAFDPLTARSARDNGALVELFRTYPGTRVNDHVARFAVWGKHTDHLLSPQPWDFAFGYGSLLDRFVGLDGKILLLGSDHDNVTFLHYAEHIANIPDKRIARFKVPVLENGVRVWREMAEYDTSNGVWTNLPTNYFALVVDSYVAAAGNRGGRVGDAESYLLAARGLLEHALAEWQAMLAGAESRRQSPR
jgi:aminoglycoside 3-N-acetyltransferase